MSFSVLEQLGSPASQVGRGLAEGLSQQLPQEIQRQRLAGALKGIRESPTLLNPLEQAEKLQRAGGDPQQIAQLMPLIQQAIGWEGTGNASKIGNVQDQVGKFGIDLPPEGEFLSPDQLSNISSQMLGAPSEEQIDQQMQAIRHRYPDADTARTKAIEILEGQRARKEQNVSSALENFRKQASLHLHKDLFGEGLSDIPGEIVEQLSRQIRGDILGRGMTPTEVQDKFTDIVKQIASASTGLKNAVAKKGPIESKKKDFLRQKKVFDKYGMGDVFTDILSGYQGITPQTAAHETSPLENSAIKGIIKKLPDIRKGGVTVLGPIGEFIADPMISALKTAGGPSRHPIPKEKMKEIISSIRPEDNLLSIEYALREKGYDVGQFAVEAADNPNLTQLQVRQLSKPARNSFLGDLFWRAFSR